MSGFDHLEGQLLASVRALAPAAERHRGPRRLLGLALLGLVASGTAVAATLTLGGQPSAPLGGAVARPADPRWEIPAGTDRYRVAIVPKLVAGQTGWCLTIAHRRSADDAPLAGRSCGPVGAAGSPVVTGGSAGYGIVEVREGRDAYAGRMFSAGIYGPQVAAVELPDGRRVRTRRDPSLPNGWRTAVIISPEPALGLRLLGADGSRIERAFGGRRRPLAVEAFDPRGGEAGAAGGAAGEARASCSLRFGGRLPTGARFEDAVRVRRVPAAAPVQAGALQACASVTVRAASGAPYRVARLVGAVDPSAAAPALPATRPIGGGLVESPGGLGSSRLTARRAGAAWLVVEGASASRRRAILRAIVG